MKPVNWASSVINKWIRTLGRLVFVFKENDPIIKLKDAIIFLGFDEQPSEWVESNSLG